MMYKIIIAFVALIVVCATICFTTHKVCNTIERTSEVSKAEHMALVNDHARLRADHDEILNSINDVGKVADENNKMLTYIYNMAKNANPDMK